MVLKTFEQYREFKLWDHDSAETKAVLIRKQRLLITGVRQSLSTHYVCESIYLITMSKGVADQPFYTMHNQNATHDMLDVQQSHCRLHVQ